MSFTGKFVYVCIYIYIYSRCLVVSYSLFHSYTRTLTNPSLLPAVTVGPDGGKLISVIGVNRTFDFQLGEAEYNQLYVYA